MWQWSQKCVFDIGWWLVHTFEDIASRNVTIKPEVCVLAGWMSNPYIQRHCIQVCDTEVKSVCVWDKSMISPYIQRHCIQKCDNKVKGVWLRWEGD
jgi:hypothetical protein